jgi:hypothetical protein
MFPFCSGVQSAWRGRAHRGACASAARRTALGWTFERHDRQLMSVFQEGATRKRAA